MVRARHAPAILIALAGASNACGCAAYRPLPIAPGPPAAAAAAAVAVVALTDDPATRTEAADVARELAAPHGMAPVLVDRVEAHLAALAAERRSEPSLGRRVEQAAELLRDAERALNKLSPAAARRSLDEAAALLGPAPAEPRAFLVWLGVETARSVADLADHKTTDAAARFREILRLRPDHRLDQARVPPEALEAFVAAQKEAPRPVNVPFRFLTQPAGGLVYVDGTEHGVAPITIELAAGAHFATARRPGLRAAPVIVTSDAGGAAVVTLLPLAPASRPEAIEDARAEVQPAAARLRPGGEAPLDGMALAALAVALDRSRIVAITAPGRAFVFDTTHGLVTPLERLGGRIRVATAAPAPPRPPAFRTSGASASNEIDGSDRPWYRTRWGWAAAVAGAAATLLALRPLGRTLPAP